MANNAIKWLVPVWGVGRVAVQRVQVVDPKKMGNRTSRGVMDEDILCMAWWGVEWEEKEKQGEEKRRRWRWHGKIGSVDNRSECRWMMARCNCGEVKACNVTVMNEKSNK